jgi:hypothetical protein
MTKNPKISKTIPLSAAFALALSTFCACAQTERPVFEIQKTAQPPAIDGRLDDPCWQTAPALTNFTQVLPVEGAPPTEKTEVRFFYDRDNLYIAIRCFDSEPGKIIAKQMLHDSDFESDDTVKIAFDTFDRQRDGYFFAVNPAGAREEGLIKNFGDEDPLWDTVWDARARIDAQGWTAELVIPFTSLSFDPRHDRWGCNIERIIRRKQETVRWTALLPAKPMTNLADFGELRGIRPERKGHGLEVKPFASLEHLDDAGTDGSAWRIKPGLDLTDRITPSLTANATFNTDFAEAEVDQRLVNLTPYPQLYPEKRDFFLQDSSLFAFGGRSNTFSPFYSRDIGLDASGQSVPLLAGGRLTGRVGDTSVALLDVQQDSYLDADSASQIGAKNLFVGRVSTLVLDESNVGFLVTHGSPMSPGDNTVAGPDFNYLNDRLPDGKQLVGHVWLLGSSSTGAVGEDAAFGADLEYPNEPFVGQVSYQRIGEDFNPALGFVQRTGISEASFWTGYVWRPNTMWIRSVELDVRPDVTTDLGNRIVAEDDDLPRVKMVNQAGDQFIVSYTLHRDTLDTPFAIVPRIVIPDGDYPHGQFKPSLTTSDSRELSASLGLDAGHFYTGTSRDYKSTVDWRPSRYVTVDLAYELQQFKLPQGRFDVRVGSAQLILAVTPDLTWSTIAQYDDLSDNLGVNSRVRWTYQPGSDIFFVVDQGYQFAGWQATHLTNTITLKWGGTFRF